MKKPQPRISDLDSPREILRNKLHELEQILQNDFADRFCRDAVRKESDQVRQLIANQLLPFEIDPTKRQVETLEDEVIDEMIEDLSHETISETTDLVHSIIEGVQTRPDYREALNSYRFDNQNILKELLPGLGYYRADDMPRPNNLFYASMLDGDFWDNVHQDSPELIRANLRRKFTEIYSSPEITLPTSRDQKISLPGLEPVIVSQHANITPGVIAIPFNLNPKYPLWSDINPDKLKWTDFPEFRDYLAGHSIISPKFKVPIFKDLPLVLKGASTYYGTRKRPAIYGDLHKSDFSRIFDNTKKVLDEQKIPYVIVD